MIEVKDIRGKRNFAPLILEIKQSFKRMLFQRERGELSC